MTNWATLNNIEGGKFTIDFTPYDLYYSSIKLLIGQTSVLNLPLERLKLTINIRSDIIMHNLPSYKEYDITDIIAGDKKLLKIVSIHSDTFNPSHNFGIFGIRIDGRLLQDGPANNDENWSEYALSTNDYQGGEEIDKLFDGSLATWTAPRINSGNSVEVDFTSLDLTYTKLEIAFGASPGSPGTVEINDQNVTANITDPPSPLDGGKNYDLLLGGW